MKVLLFGIDMEGLHGSFVHILEYAQYFKSIGAEATVIGAFLGEGNRKMLEAVGARTLGLDDDLRLQKYDLVYALHLFLFPAFLARGLKYDKAILASLSGSAAIEAFPPSIMWPQFDLMTAISEENIKAMEKKFGIDPKYLTLIPNHIPLPFLERAREKQEWNPNLEKVCVVSNHFIPELFALSRVAPFKMDFYGWEYNTQRPITPELLLQYDSVVTIGKTAQYAMGLGIPIFEYDKFGGCGYITPANILEEEKTNFSGRGTGRKLAAEELLSDMMDNYAEASASAGDLRETALEKYAIDKLIENSCRWSGGANPSVRN